MSLYDDAAVKQRDARPEHYYGDTVRKLFLVSGVLMLLGYAFFSDLIEIPMYAAIGGAIILAFLAGLQNPRHLLLNLLNTLVSAIACFAFAYTGIRHYMHATDFSPWFFWSNQILALLFLLATYYSSKTLRAKMMGKA